MEECEHKRIRKNYPFGKNSAPIMMCKDCKKSIKLKVLELKRREKELQKRRIQRWQKIQN